MFSIPRRHLVRKNIIHEVDIMAKIKITIPELNKELEVEDGITAKDVLARVNPENKKEIIAAKFNDQLIDLNKALTSDGTLSFITVHSDEGLHILRHSAAHLLAHAVTELYPEAKPTIGPPTEDGFFYDIEFPQKISEKDLPKIEQKMKELAKADLPIKRIEMPKEDLIKLYEGKNEYKVEMIKNKIEDGSASSVYQQGEFIDLCRGPHVPSTEWIKAFKLVRASDVYWLGDANNPQLTRIYGYCFPTKEELKDYIKRMKEAEQRRHQRIGTELDLFSFNELAPGAPFFHPKGTVIYNELMNLMREQYFERGYDEVITPQVYKIRLWEISKHWPLYRENMFLINLDDENLAGLKPMNCPGHILIYKTKRRSYRELPLRLADFSPLHRAELAGTLQGLLRVVKFSQDDAHIFCRLDQVKEEMRSLFQFIEFIYRDVFGFDYHIEFSTRPEKYAGSLEVWNKAEQVIQEVLEEEGIEYQLNPGDGAFYGPKIDFHLVDAIGRSHQCGTIQLDFVQPENFNCVYYDENQHPQRVVIIHRAILGSIERFMGILIEHYAGKFPVWLAPEQVRVMSITDDVNDYAREVQQALRKYRIRAGIDVEGRRINKKILFAQKDKVPYFVIVGRKEKEKQLISIRTRDGEVINDISLDDFITILKRKITNRDRDITLKISSS